MRFGIAGMKVFLDHGGRYERWRTRWNDIEYLRTSRLFGERIGVAASSGSRGPSRPNGSRPAPR
jgi:hypothetical protein